MLATAARPAMSSAPAQQKRQVLDSDEDESDDEHVTAGKSAKKRVPISESEEEFTCQPLKTMVMRTMRVRAQESSRTTTTSSWTMMRKTTNQGRRKARRSGGRRLPPSPPPRQCCPVLVLKLLQSPTSSLLHHVARKRPTQSCAQRTSPFRLWHACSGSRGRCRA